jgi:hypothetical protein
MPGGIAPFKFTNRDKDSVDITVEEGAVDSILVI